MSLYKRATGLAAAAMILSAAAASAEAVKLSSVATGFVLTGDLIEFDGANYTVNSSIGRLTIAAAGMVCEGPGCPDLTTGAVPATGLDKTFGVFGSNAIGESLMPGLIEAYSFAKGTVAERELGTEGSRSVIRLLNDEGTEVAAIDLNASGSSDAFPGLISGDALIGMSSRRVLSSEIAAFESAGLAPIDRAGYEHVLALDGLIVIVSPDNPIQTINIDDLADIFSGDINNWADLGGPDLPISLYAAAPNTGDGESFASLLLSPRGASMAPDVRTFTSGRDLSDAVAGDRAGIGFTGLAFERSARALDIETSCGIVVSPTDFNVKTEEYPLSRRLFLYTTGDVLPESARGLLEYALSDDAQAEISDIGFVNQSITAVPLNGQGRRIAEAFIQQRDAAGFRLMRELTLELLDGDRLSTTLRFQKNSSVLDTKSAGDLTRLARYIANEGLRNQELVLVGFADDATRFEANLALSTQRAAQIRAALEAELVRIGADAELNIATLGYGELAPVSCGDELSSVSNRRVEVWVRDQL
ncbi:MAG: phosphate ABC transporter substrate-binding/OmpA family protein [Pseudomonadota bacterium]